ncbi:MAG: type II toxin-antitoxin system prevent-host-death family antitoxin [Beijerinckiaceae bacterium]|nr:type II toxin-antitoxin system prevent-host-death family antitoxin [Beijerinckiaceae bacterium]
MNVPVSEAKGQLTELVRRAQAGEDVVLTRHGLPVVRLEPVERRLSATEKRRIIEEAKRMVPPEALNGPDAASSQDFLYDEDGLPR